MTQKAAERKRIRKCVCEIAGQMYAEGTLTVMPVGDQPVLLAALEQRGIVGLQNTRLASMIAFGGKAPSPFHTIAKMLNVNNIGGSGWTTSRLRYYVVQHQNLHGIARKDCALLYGEIVKIEESKAIEESASPVESSPVNILAVTSKPVLTDEKIGAFRTLDELVRGLAVVMGEHADWVRYAGDLEAAVAQQDDEIRASRAAMTAEIQKRKALERKVRDMKAGRSGVVRLPLSGPNLLRLISREDVEYIAGEIPGLGQTVVVEWVDNVE